MNEQPQEQGILASFEHLDTTVEAVEELREAGFTEITAFTPMPEHHVEDALGYGASPVRIFTLAGGLLGAATGLGFTIFASMDWPLVTGGKPIVSIPPYVIPIFEMTILFGALATVIGLFINIRIPNLKPLVVYNPDFSGGHFGVYVKGPADRLDEARRILEGKGPDRLQDDRELEEEWEESAGHV